MAPKIRVTAVDVDGERYEFDDLANGLKVGSNVSKITIDFAVFSYLNRGDIQVEYMLEGFDIEPIRISGRDTLQAVYTNLAGGTYTFHINAYNADGTPCENEISFTIDLQEDEEKDYPVYAFNSDKVLLTIHRIDHGVKVSSSTCPHKDCVQTGYVNVTNKPIICAYNQVYIIIETKAAGTIR